MVSILYDEHDREILTLVNRILQKGKSSDVERMLFDVHLHPRGIKELAGYKEIRVAMAMANLLDSLEVGGAEGRLGALQALRDEVLISAESHLSRNTARVLIEVMKELIRCQGAESQQLQLAHDFRKAMAGNPGVVRPLLKKYHLLEMPEAWNQVAFDHHVHDAYTKGRKSPTHLIMDAWVKGIQDLTVIYYNYVTPEGAGELLEAARIMEINVRIGIELSAEFRGRYVQLIWVPRGFMDTTDFLAFLDTESVAKLMREGQLISSYQALDILAVLERFNSHHRQRINAMFDIALEAIDPYQLELFVAQGQYSRLHLAELIHSRLMQQFERKLDELRAEFAAASSERKIAIERIIAEMNHLDVEELKSLYLTPNANPDLPDPALVHDDTRRPEGLKLSPLGLIEILNGLPCGNRVTLNLSRLSALDVVELLYDCKGYITHLEIYNHKDYLHGQDKHYSDIQILHRAINKASIIILKKTIRQLIHKMEQDTTNNDEKVSRTNKMKSILHDMISLHSYYQHRPLGIRLGTDSVGKSSRTQGMGLVLSETLDYRGKKEAMQHSVLLPVHIKTHFKKSYQPYNSFGSFARFLNRLGYRLPVLRNFWRRSTEWEVADYVSEDSYTPNVYTLGRVSSVIGNGLRLKSEEVPGKRQRFSWRYLNTGIKNCLKVFIGFIPAFLTFYLTKDWWVLAYLGAPIWFAITSTRTILQSVLGGGGISRSPLLRWKDYVSWERVADSLFYTGFSVPLLDFIVKAVVLDQQFNINTSTDPVALYTFMALANGVYISSHNAIRGFPRWVIIGNLFRSVLSIPVALFYNYLITSLLGLAGFTAIAPALQKWAAIISKAASDTVAGIIEGAADRLRNRHLRMVDYELKIQQLFGSYSEMELLFPEEDLATLLTSPKAVVHILRTKQQELFQRVICDALDMLYFWMYQPRARSAFLEIMEALSPDERMIILRFQSVLKRQKQISKLFVNGLVGKRFSRALSFYLDRSEEYLATLEKLIGRPLVLK